MASDMEVQPDNSERAEQAVRNLIRSIDNKGLAADDAEYLIDELLDYVAPGDNAPDEYFVLVNDEPPFTTTGPVVTGPGDDMDFYTSDRRDAMLERLEQVRETSGNPHINPYRMFLIPAEVADDE